MPDHDLCKAAAHAVLAGTSIWVGIQMSDIKSFGFACIVLHAVLGVIGLLGSLLRKFSNSNMAYRLIDWQHTLYKLAVSFGLPLMVTHFHITNGTQFELAIIHALVAFLPYLTDSISDVDRGVRDMILAGNMASLCYLGYIKDNHFMLWTAACYAVDYFLVKKRNRIAGFEAKDVFVSVLGLFNILAWKAM